MKMHLTHLQWAMDVTLYAGPKWVRLLPMPVHPAELTSWLPMVKYLLRWCSILNRIFARFLFDDTLKQIRRPLEVASPPFGHHIHLAPQQRAVRTLFRWLPPDQQNVPGLHLLLGQLQLGTTHDILLAQRPFLFQMTKMCMSLTPIQRLSLSGQRIQALMMTTRPPYHLTVLMKILQPQPQMHRKLLPQFLVLVTLFADGHKSMIRSSSVSNRMPELDILGKRSANDFTENLTAAKPAGIG